MTIKNDQRLFVLHTLKHAGVLSLGKEYGKIWKTELGKISLKRQHEYFHCVIGIIIQFFLQQQMWTYGNVR